MARLNQILAVEKGVKNRQNQVITEAYHLFQKTEPLTGIARSYQPKNDEDADKLPGENKLVQVRANDLLGQIAKAWAEMIDVTMTKDEANMHARANVEVDGQILLSDVPVTTLLYLEKQMVDLHTCISKLPTLDPAEKWSRDDAQNCWATDPIQTTRTKKVLRNHVKAEATDKHPAQVEVYSEDVIVGFWRTIKYSGAIPATRKAELLERVEKLQRAVKMAREAANSIECAPQKGGEKLFGFLLK